MTVGQESVMVVGLAEVTSLLERQRGLLRQALSVGVELEGIIAQGDAEGLKALWIDGANLSSNFEHWTRRYERRGSGCRRPRSGRGSKWCGGRRRWRGCGSRCWSRCGDKSERYGRRRRNWRGRRAGWWRRVRRPTHIGRDAWWRRGSWTAEASVVKSELLNKPQDSAADLDAAETLTARAGGRLDELADIIRAYNQVTENLQRSHEALRGQVARLQEELASTNAQLQRQQAAGGAGGDGGGNCP